MQGTLSPPKLFQSFISQATAQTFVKPKETDRKNSRGKFSSIEGTKWGGKACMAKLHMRTAYMVQQAIPSAALPVPSHAALTSPDSCPVQLLEEELASFLSAS